MLMTADDHLPLQQNLVLRIEGISVAAMIILQHQTMKLTRIECDIRGIGHSGSSIS